MFLFLKMDQLQLHFSST